MSSLVLLMALVCLAPVLASLAFTLLAPIARTHRGVVGVLGALFGFLLGLVAVFCGVMIPLSSQGLSGQPGRGVDSPFESLGLAAGIAALVATLLSCILTRTMARAIAKKEGGA